VSRDRYRASAIVAAQAKSARAALLFKGEDFKDPRRIRRLTKDSLSGPLRPLTGTASFDRRPRRLHIPPPDG
jgi:hypothetical protein